MKPVPQIGDIWEWTSASWDKNKRKYVVMILTEPKPSQYSQGWQFDGLELDGDAPGVVDIWSMNLSDDVKWRKLA
jgi:hypothetical protein